MISRILESSPHTALESYGLSGNAPYSSRMARPSSRMNLSARSASLSGLPEEE